MSVLARALGSIVALGLLISGCTGVDGGARDGARPNGSRPDDAPASPEVVQPPERGPGSALAALERLCTLPKPKVGQGSGVPAEGPTPPTIASVMQQVERIRGFDFSEPVVADPVTPQEIAEGYADYLDRTFPDEFYLRRSLAWQTIGVVPEGTSIRDDLFAYGSTQVIGYYDTLTGELVFVGEADPSPLERITLAHELTHAIDDQRFGLERIDRLGAECRDEELEASLALVEGNATFFMLRWAESFLSLGEQVEVGLEAAAQSPPAGDVAPFIAAIQEWPYTDGLTFITRLEREGGLGAIDAAFREMPVSTEQIIHPERYPNDVPTPVDVRDVADELGDGWRDLDVQSVGEMWLDLALGLRLDTSEAASASAGWDGGIYRAWTDGTDIAVVLATEWDTERDAEEFAGALGRWISAGDQVAAVLPVDGTTVRALFATDPGTRRALAGAV